jgi:hypothetical protein
MRIAAAAIAAVVLSGSVVLAQDAPPKPPLRQLIGAGFEIKDVTAIPSDELAAMGYDKDTPAVIVTLQLGNAVAVCEFAMANWSTLNPDSIDGTTQCDVMDAEPGEPPAPTVRGAPQNSATQSGSGSQELPPAENLRR